MKKIGLNTEIVGFDSGIIKLCLARDCENREDTSEISAKQETMKFIK